MRARRAVVALALAGAALLPAAAWADPSVARATALLDRGALPEAAREVAALAPAAGRSRAFLRLRARLRLATGDAAGALEDARAGGERPEVVGLLARTAQAHRRMAVFASADGRAEVRAPADLEHDVARPALALAARLAPVLAATFGVAAPDRARVEVLPDAATFAGVAALELRAVVAGAVASATVAGRALVLSPGATAAGHPWADALAGALARAAFERASAGRAPAWLADGVARALARSWRAADTGPSPRAWRALGDAASLPSPDAGGAAPLALAAAETFALTLGRAGGAGTLARLAGALAAGADPRAACERAAGLAWPALVARWRADVAAGVRASAPLARRLASGAAPAGAERHVRLAELLLGAGEGAAARIEAERALARAPYDPRGERLRAAGLLAEGRGAEAVAALRDLVARERDDGEAWVALAAALAQTGDRAGAVEAVTEAGWHRPLDPALACLRARLGPDDAARERARRRCPSP